MNVDFENCIILFGGSSEERLVSVASAQNLVSYIPEATLWFWNKRNEVFKIAPEELKNHTNAFTEEFKTSATANFSTLEQALGVVGDRTIIICLHGTEGEDGTLQAKLEAKGIRFTGSDSKSSAQAFDKRATKLKARSHNLPVAEDLAILNFSDFEVNQLKEFLTKHKKIVLKPLANGSSIGLYVVSSDKEFQDALRDIKSKSTSTYICEPFISGREITVGVWQRADSSLTVLPCSEVRLIPGGQFDYQGKYLGKGVEELTPAPLSEDESVACQAVALRLHEIMNCRGYSRTDMILTEQGPILLEINTLPGLSKGSFIPQQLKVIDVTLKDFFQEQLELK
jgi:D-alanine-D-alanine ligase